MVISGSWESHLPASLKVAYSTQGPLVSKISESASFLCPQVISMVMVAVGVYARLMKHAGEL